MLFCAWEPTPKTEMNEWTFPFNYLYIEISYSHKCTLYTHICNGNAHRTHTNGKWTKEKKNQREKYEIVSVHCPIGFACHFLLFLHLWCWWYFSVVVYIVILNTPIVKFELGNCRFVSLFCLSTMIIFVLKIVPYLPSEFILRTNIFQNTKSYFHCVLLVSAIVLLIYLKMYLYLILWSSRK